MDHSWQVGQPRRIHPQFIAKFLNLARCPLIVMTADGPYPSGLGAELPPKLLRHPGDATHIGERPTPQAVADHAQTKFREDVYRDTVKGVGRRHPSISANPVARENRQSAAQLEFLFATPQSSELTLVVQ